MTRTIIPSSFATIAKTGSVGGSWTFPASWEDAEDASYASSPTLALLGEYTPYAALTNLGITLASDVLITGLMLRIVWDLDVSGARIVVDDVRLVQSSAVVGSNLAKALFGNPTKEVFTTDKDFYTLPISQIDFGTLITEDEADASDFGIAFSGRCIAAGSAASLRLDYVEVILQTSEGREMGYGVPVDPYDESVRCEETGLLIPRSRSREVFGKTVVDFAADRNWVSEWE